MTATRHSHLDKKSFGFVVIGPRVLDDTEAGAGLVGTNCRVVNVRLTTRDGTRDD
jgi:hypothetical protein